MLIRQGRDVIHQGKLVTFCEYHYEDEAGQHVKREIVEHPGASVIIPMISKNEVLLVEQYRCGANRRLLEFPAGCLEKGEDPRACALRELEEETGYRAGKLDLLFSMYPSAAFLTEKMNIFLATDLTALDGQRLDEGEEDLSVVRMNFRDLRIQLRAGNIQDAKTIAGLGYLMTFKPYLGREEDPQSSEA